METLPFGKWLSAIYVHVLDTQRHACIHQQRHVRIKSWPVYNTGLRDVTSVALKRTCGRVRWKNGWTNRPVYQGPRLSLKEVAVTKKGGLETFSILFVRLGDLTIRPWVHVWWNSYGFALHICSYVCGFAQHKIRVVVVILKVATDYTFPHFIISLFIASLRLFLSRAVLTIHVCVFFVDEMGF